MASRLGLYDGLDATYGLGRRPDSWWLLIWTPVECWRGVQIVIIWRNGRQWVVGVASRFLVVADLDACWVSAWRPDWESRAEWTPVGGWRGVQIGVVWRNGRHLRAGAAYRLGLYGKMDASGRLARRPDSWRLLIWTPVGCRRGVQIGDLEWTPLQYLTGVQSKLISSSGRLQSYKEVSTTFPLIGCEGLSPLFYAHKRGFCTEAPFATFQS